MDRLTENENQKKGQSRAFGVEQTPEGVTTPFSVNLWNPDATDDRFLVITGISNNS